ncbi:MAG: GNAT family N-acetyltransferase [Candidatus Binataceae bacterium]
MQKFAQATMQAGDETKYSHVTFGAENFKIGQRILWVRAAGRIVGFLVVDSTPKSGYWLPLTELMEALEDEDRCTGLGDRTEINQAGVAFMWVLRKHRGHGLGKALVHCAFKAFNGSWDNIAFKKPFTPDGARLIHRIALQDGRSGIWVY